MKNNLETMKVPKDTSNWDEMDWADYGMKISDKLEDFEAELRAICKNCNHQPTKDFYSCHTCHEINPKEILKEE